MEKTTHSKTADSIRPPATSIGVIGWMRANLFNGWFNSHPHPGGCLSPLVDGPTLCQMGVYQQQLVYHQ